MGMLEGKRVYLSGPVEGVEDEAPGAFAKAAQACYRAGAVEVFDPMAPDVQARREPYGYGRGMHLLDDLHELTTRAVRAGRMAPYYDAVVMMPGYGPHQGCFLEMREAKEAGDGD